MIINNILLREDDIKDILEHYKIKYDEFVSLTLDTRVRIYPSPEEALKEYIVNLRYNDIDPIEYLLEMEINTGSRTMELSEFILHNDPRYHVLSDTWRVVYIDK